MGLGNLFGRKIDADIQSYMEIMVILSMADGELEDDEINDLIVTCLKHPRLSSMSEKQFTTAVDRAFRNVQREGVDARLRALQQNLPSRDQRLDVMGMALSISASDGTIEEAEMVILKKMQSAFGLSDADIDKLIADIL